MRPWVQLCEHVKIPAQSAVEFTTSATGANAAAATPAN